MKQEKSEMDDFQEKNLGSKGKILFGVLPKGQFTLVTLASAKSLAIGPLIRVLISNFSQVCPWGL